MKNWWSFLEPEETDMVYWMKLEILKSLEKTSVS
jgi:hypothetical protein